MRVPALVVHLSRELVNSPHENNLIIDPVTSDSQLSIRRPGVSGQCQGSCC